MVFVAWTCGQAAKTYPTWAAAEPVSLRRPEPDTTQWQDETKPLPPLQPGDWIVVAVNGKDVFYDLTEPGHRKHLRENGEEYEVDGEAPEGGELLWASFEAAVFTMKDLGLPLAIEFARSAGPLRHPSLPYLELAEPFLVSRRLWCGVIS